MGWALGHERVRGRTVELHCPRTIDIALQFASDFKPHDVLLAGDWLDCGAISHWNDRKPGNTEDLRLWRDAEGLRDNVITPIESEHGRRAKLIFGEGNHEDWLNQLVIRQPPLAGLVEAENLLSLKRWTVLPQGWHHSIGKLTFQHGDTVTGGEMCAKSAVIAAEQSIRFGHFHTYQAYTKISTVNSREKHTGMSMPCCCRRGPGYGKGKANKWINGFLYGWVLPNGNFSDYTVFIIDNKAIINGKVYRG